MQNKTNEIYRILIHYPIRRFGKYIYFLLVEGFPSAFLQKLPKTKAQLFLFFVVRQNNYETAGIYLQLKLYQLYFVKVYFEVHLIA